MTADLPNYYFRVRENGAAVFRVGTENRQRRIELEEIAVVNVKNGNVKPHGDTDLTKADLTAIADWLAARQAQLSAREVDDILRTQVSKYLVRRSVEKAGVSVPTSRLAPLFSRDETWMMGCLMALLRIPLKLILFPIRAVTNVLFLVRHVGRDFAEIFLLGEVIDRGIDAQLIRGDETDDALQLARSVKMRRAFDRALKETDTQLL